MIPSVAFTAVIHQTKAYHFADDQIDAVLALVRNKAQSEGCEANQTFLSNLADLIEDQIVNHPDND